MCPEVITKQDKGGLGLELPSNITQCDYLPSRADVDFSLQLEKFVSQKFNSKNQTQSD